MIYILCTVQEAAGFQDYALDLKNPDFVKYAEAYGAKGYRIREAGPLTGATLLYLQSHCALSEGCRATGCVAKHGAGMCR